PELADHRSLDRRFELRLLGSGAGPTRRLVGLLALLLGLRQFPDLDRIRRLHTEQVLGKAGLEFLAVLQCIIPALLRIRLVRSDPQDPGLGGLSPRGLDLLLDRRAV